MNGRYRIAPPKAAALIESLRGLGYSAETAIADIIDNSISAHARNVDVTFVWAGANSVVTIRDDGDGMDEQQLDRAMRLGEAYPSILRAEHDLGRFGLGLKTASFSQCRRLTVASRKDSRLNSLHWDLDLLAASQSGEWLLMEGAPESALGFVRPLEEVDHGTLVVWECLDRIVTAEFSEQDFLNLIDRVESHLAMIFHRYLDGSAPRTRIAINGHGTKAWDPFLLSHPATWRSPTERIASTGGIVEVQCFVLPHRDRLDSDVFESTAGPDGWTAQQGFYVYRNMRMLVAGSWLGLGPGRSWTKEEPHRLARIRLELGNSADTAWKLDIRKSTAHPPVEIRERLARLAEDTRARARRVFAHRGQPVTSRGVTIQQAWVAEHLKSGLRYKVDENHPAVRMILDEAGPLLPAVKAMLRVIEETVPVRRVWLDTAESKDTPLTGFSSASTAEILSVMLPVYRNLVLRKGMSSNVAREHLLITEPFNQYPELAATLPDLLEKSED